MKNKKGIVLAIIPLIIAAGMTAAVVRPLTVKEERQKIAQDFKSIDWGHFCSGPCSDK